jgi:hypothetical protein
MSWDHGIVPLRASSFDLSNLILKKEQQK